MHNIIDGLGEYLRIKLREYLNNKKFVKKSELSSINKIIYMNYMVGFHVQIIYLTFNYNSI